MDWKMEDSEDVLNVPTAAMDAMANLDTLGVVTANETTGMRGRETGALAAAKSYEDKVKMDPIEYVESKRRRNERQREARSEQTNDPIAHANDPIAHAEFKQRTNERRKELRAKSSRMIRLRMQS